MTEQTTKPTETPDVDQYHDDVVIPLVEGINALAAEVRRNSVAHGFGEHGDRLRKELSKAESNMARMEAASPPYAPNQRAWIERRLNEARENYSAYVGNRLMLIAGEVTEAHEEVRNGLDFSTRFTDAGKPEGLGSELADALIRTLDTAVELGVDMEQELRNKMPFNYGRPAMHGRKF